MATNDPPTVSSTKSWGLSFALISSISFGASGPLGKALMNAGLDPLQAVWLRMAGAAIILVPLALAIRRRAALPGSRILIQLVGYGLVGVASTQGFYFIAASRIPVGVAVLLQFLGPVFVVLWIRFVRRSSVPRSAAIGVILALIGLAFVVEVWAGQRLDPLGLLAGLGAGMCMAAYFLIIDRTSGDIDPLVMTAWGILVAAIALGLVSSPWAIPWQALGNTVPIADLAVSGWVLAIWIILVSTVVGELTRVAAVHRLTAPIAGAISYIEAVAAALIAWMVLGEQLTLPQAAGGLILLAGAFIAQRPGR